MQPRRAIRHALPANLAIISAELTSRDGTVHVGKLWDLSSRGACMVLVGSRLIDIFSLGVLEILDPHSDQRLSLEVTVRWCEPATQITFLGLEFSVEGIGSDTFLAPFMQVSWVDAMEVRELGDFS